MNKTIFTINILLLKPFLIATGSSCSIEVLVFLERYRVTQRVSLCICMHGNNSESISFYTKLYNREQLHNPHLGCLLCSGFLFELNGLPSIAKQQKSVITGSRLLYILHALGIRITDLGITLVAEVEELYLNKRLSQILLPLL